MLYDLYDEGFTLIERNNKFHSTLLDGSGRRERRDVIPDAEAAGGKQLLIVLPRQGGPQTDPALPALTWRRCGGEKGVRNRGGGRVGNAADAK